MILQLIECLESLENYGSTVIELDEIALMEAVTESLNKLGKKYTMKKSEINVSADEKETFYQITLK